MPGKELEAVDGPHTAAACSENVHQCTVIYIFVGKAAVDGPQLTAACVKYKQLVSP
jgi:hypothetical protein